MHAALLAHRAAWVASSSSAFIVICRRAPARLRRRHAVALRSGSHLSCALWPRNRRAGLVLRSVRHIALLAVERPAPNSQDSNGRLCSGGIPLVASSGHPMSLLVLASLVVLLPLLFCPRVATVRLVCFWFRVYSTAMVTRVCMLLLLAMAVCCTLSCCVLCDPMCH